MMDLQVFISKKGTKVVKATDLHQALQLMDHHYPANVRKWINDIYEFTDGIRKPVRMQDFAPRKPKQPTVIKDYYLSVELAKMIALKSRSKVKQKYAAQLLELEKQTPHDTALSNAQVLELIELVKAMSSMSCQEHFEQQHHKIYEARNGGKANNWWQHRAQVVGYSSEKLRRQLQHKGKKASGQSQRQMLLQLDPYETIRTGIIDLFMAMGKDDRYAQNMGDMAKALAESMQMDIFDDRKGGNLFAPHVNAELIRKLRTFQPPAEAMLSKAS
jgi:phage anti-repressor protein